VVQYDNNNQGFPRSSITKKTIDSLNVHISADLCHHQVGESNVTVLIIIITFWGFFTSTYPQVSGMGYRSTFRHTLRFAERLSSYPAIFCQILIISCLVYYLLTFPHCSFLRKRSKLNFKFVCYTRAIVTPDVGIICEIYIESVNCVLFVIVNQVNPRSLFSSYILFSFFCVCVCV
jgi:hypothetical protein